MARKVRGGSRVAKAERERLFAAAFIRNGGNGTAAAREAGYTGNSKTLGVTASRLLNRASVRAILDDKVQKAEARIGGGMDEAEILQRLTAQARADLSNFISFITPELAQAGIDACGADEDRAKRLLRIIEGAGFVVDVEAAVKAGHGAQLRELTMEQDPFGAPKLKIKVADPRPALETLARIKGMLRDKPPEPPRPPTLVLAMLGALPQEQLAALNAAMEAGLERQRQLAAGAITVPAQHVG